MPNTPTMQSQAQLLAFINANFVTNNNKEITGDELNQFLLNFVVSVPNLISQPTFTSLSEYDPAKTYQIGMCSVRLGVLKQCKVANTTGAYNDSNWDSLTGVELITWLALSGAERNGTLRQGQFYFVTDRNIFGYASNTFSFTATSKILRVPKYYNGSTGFKVWNPWDATDAVWTPGTRVVYGGLVYRIKVQPLASVLPPPDQNPITGDYTLELTSSNTYYQNIVVNIKYDLQNDYIYHAEDATGSQYSCPMLFRDEIAETGQPVIDKFAWGNPRHYGVKIVNSFCDSLSYPGEFSSVTSEPGSIWTLLTGADDSEFRNCTIENDVILDPIAHTRSGKCIGVKFRQGARLSSEDYDYSHLPGYSVTPIGFYIAEWNNFEFGLNWVHDGSTGGTYLPANLVDRIAVRGLNNVAGYIDLALMLAGELDFTTVRHLGVMIINGVPSGSFFDKIANYPTLHPFRIMQDAMTDPFECRKNTGNIYAPWTTDFEFSDAGTASFIEFEHNEVLASPIVTAYNKYT